MAPRLKASNNFVTELVSGITASDTSFVVADASKAPDEGPFRFSIDEEIMEAADVNKVTNTLIDVERGVEGTVATAHDAGAKVYHRFTAGAHMELADDADLQALGSAFTSHANNKSNPHEVTAGQIGAETPAGAQDKVDAHANRTDNPHSVTAQQAGAAPIAHVGAGGDAHAAATTSVAGFMTASDKSKLDGVAPGAVRCATGAYTGDGTNGRLINIGFTPVLVFIWSKNSGRHSIRFTQDTANQIRSQGGTQTNYLSSISFQDSRGIVPGGFMVRGSSLDEGGNYEGVEYEWEAWG